MSEQNKPKKKYTRLGLYKRPSAEQLEKFPNSPQRPYVSVYTGKDNTPVVIKNGDTLSFTLKADKLKDLAEAHASGKLTKELYDFFTGPDQFGNPDVISEVLLIQK